MAMALSVPQPAPACSEHELVAAVRRGSDRAFEELYSRYRARIGSSIFRMIGDHARTKRAREGSLIPRAPQALPAPLGWSG